MLVKTLPLSLLALAVAAASSPIHAETYQADNGPKTWENVVIAEGLGIGGELTTPANALILKPGTHVQGNLVIDASINATGSESSQDRYARPLTLGEGLIVFSNEVRIDGDLINNGNLTATGISAVGIQGRNLSIDGMLSNTGLISAQDAYILSPQNHLLDDAMPAGISLSETRLGSLSNSGRIEVISADIGRGIELISTSLIGALENTSSGSVKVTGDEVHAIAVKFKSDIAELINAGAIRATGIKSPGDSSNLSEANGITVGDSVVRGRLLNSGTITVSGYEATGIDLIAYGSNQARIDGDLINTGGIDVTAVAENGATARAIDISNATIGGTLNNSGSITASGADSVGIYVEKSHIAGDIFNSGTIKGDDFGIWIGDNSVAPVHVTQSAGLLQGGQYAVQGGSGNQVSVELSGGTISGNLAGIFKLDVTGKGIFDGDSISTVAPSTGEAGKGWVDLYNSSDSPNGTAGHLVLLRPHTTLNGELEVNTGATVELSLSQATNANQAILDVNGTAYFANGSRLLLTPVGSDFSADGKQYLLLAAETIDNQGLQVSSSSALLNVDQFNVGDNQIVATVSGKAASQADDILAGAGASGNAQAAFAPFYSGVLSKMDSNDAVFQAFANAGEAELAKLAEQLTPQVDGAASQAATGAQRLTSSAVGSRTSSLRGGSSGSSFSQAGVWVQGLSSSADQGRRGGIAGYDADSKGISIGIDGKLSDNLTLGVAYSNLRTDVKSDTGNKTDVDSQLLTLYSGFEQGNLFVDASLSYGINDNSSKRYIAGTQAKGNYDSSLLGLNVTAGYGLHAGNITLEPRVAGRYSRVDIDGYREKGSSAALRTEDQRYEVIELGAGARLASQIRVGQGSLEPELRLMAYHDFAADQARSTSSYVLGGTPFVTSGAKPSRDSYEAGIGLNYRIGAFTLGGSYDRIGKSDFDADVFQAKVRYDF